MTVGAEVLRADRGAPPPPPSVPGHGLRLTGRYALLVFAALIVVFPIYSAVVLAIQPAAALFDFPGLLLPTAPTLRAFQTAWTEGDLGRFLVNSTIQAGTITVSQVLTSILAGYAFAFLRFPAKQFTFYAFLATLMIPTEVMIVAQFQIVSDLGWVNNYEGLVAPFLAYAFGTFLIRQAFLSIPNDLRDAAAMDGYGHLGFLRHVAVPLARPAIAAFTVFSFLLAWNQYLWPLLVADDRDHRTVQIGLRSLSAGNPDELNLVMAGTLIAAIPIAAVLIAFQRHLVRGLTAGAVKG